MKGSQNISQQVSVTTDIVNEGGKQHLNEELSINSINYRFIFSVTHLENLLPELDKVNQLLNDVATKGINITPDVMSLLSPLYCSALMKKRSSIYHDGATIK